jgi:hypothetical protein
VQTRTQISRDFFIEEPPKRPDFGAQLIDLCVEGKDYSTSGRVVKRNMIFPETKLGGLRVFGARDC